MVKDYFKELYEAKKELLRCYTWMLEVSEMVETFPRDEISASKFDIEEDIKDMDIDIIQEKEDE